MSRFPNTTLARVEPVNLRAARRAMPPTSGAPELVPPRDLARMRALLSAPNPEVHEYTRRELSAISSLADDASLRPAALRVLLKNRGKLRDGILAHVLSHVPDCAPLLEEAATRALRAPLRGPAWFRAQDAVSLRAGDLEARALRCRPGGSVPAFLSAAQLTLTTPLGQSVIDTWLAAVPTRALVANQEENQAWAVSLADAEPRARTVFDRMLLHRASEGGGERGSTSIEGVIQALDGLRAAYGGWPRHSLQKQRWRKHHPEVQAIAHRFWIGRELEDFFEKMHGDPDRLGYWRRWIPHIADARAFRRVDAFAMHIGGMVVVEFGNVGNAAYIYDIPAWSSLAPADPGNEKDLKDRRSAAGRIIHNGAWAAAADDLMESLTGLTPERR